MLCSFTYGHSLTFVLGRDTGRKWLGVQYTSLVTMAKAGTVSYHLSSSSAPVHSQHGKGPLSSVYHPMSFCEVPKSSKG